MKQISTNLLAVLCVMLLLFTACKKNSDFTVEGVVSGADGQMMYLENVGVSTVELMDSVKLTAAGKFSFTKPRPAFPDFYRLRLNNQLINFSVDSTETISFVADAGTFATSYSVEGSENCKAIKNITLAQLDANQAIHRLRKESESGLLADSVYSRQVLEAAEAYKDVARKYIYSAPMSAAAYFALFQKLNNYLIFDPLNNKDDVKCFAAVATSLNNAFPHAVRSKNLYNIVIKGMKNTRQPQTKALEIPQDKIVETGIIDIALRDVKGNVRKLTDLKGKVVLLDFSVFQSPAGAPHNLMLRELYNEYAKQGLEIYQVSLDADEHYWKTAADNLPWVCVRDGNGVYSTNVAVYNVRQAPSIFLINRNNEFKLRGEDIKDLEAAVKSLL